MPDFIAHSRQYPVARRGGKVAPPGHARHSLGNALGLSGVAIGSQPGRRRMIQRESIYGISKPDIRRLARRGGVKRISKDVYPLTRNVLRGFLQDVFPP
jgi:histone H4